MRDVMRNRWSDNDRYFGPFTFSAATNYRPTAIVLESGGDARPGASLRFSLRGHTLIVAIPAIIKPSRRWVDMSDTQYFRADRSLEPKAAGRGYWDIHRRSFGFSYSEGFLQVFLGPQTMDSSTTKSWCKTLPWAEWRHVRRSLYGLQGEHFWTEPERVRGGRLGDDEWRADYEARRAAEDACPSQNFGFLDFDGETLTARTRIEEREWRFGEGWFKWLSVFRKPRILRSLNLHFSGETGKRKGSWKGGTIGHSIEMLPGELHEAAFRRYCEQNNMTFKGPTSPSPLKDIEARQQNEGRG